MHMKKKKKFARLAYLTRNCTYTVNILWILEHSTLPTNRYVLLYIRKLWATLWLVQAFLQQSKTFTFL